MGFLNKFKLSLHGMRSEEAVSAAAATRAKEASRELQAENETISQNRRVAAALNVSQLSERRRDRKAEETANRAANDGMDPRHSAATHGR